MKYQANTFIEVKKTGKYFKKYRKPCKRQEKTAIFTLNGEGNAGSKYDCADKVNKKNIQV